MSSSHGDTSSQVPVEGNEGQRISGTESDGSDSPNSCSVNQADSVENLEDYTELIERGSNAMKAKNFAEAIDCFGRAIEYKTGSSGNLSPVYLGAYLNYGFALYSKAKEDAKQDDSTEEDKVEDDNEDKVEDDDEGSKVGEAAESMSDLDRAKKVLETAREMVRMYSSDAMQRRDIFAALEDLSSEAEDIKRFLRDHHDSLSILEHRQFEPDSLRMVELNFRICMTMEVGTKPEKAITYCEKALSVCNARLLRLMDEVKASESNPSHLDIKSEITTLQRISTELDEKLLQLQQLALQPTPLSSEDLEMISAKSISILNNMPTVSNSSETSNKNKRVNADSPTDSSANTGASGMSKCNKERC